MKERGFTLLEMLLVLVIISSVMVMFVGYTLRKSEETRIDKMVMTIQQILSANLSYYNDHGKWPGCTYGNGCFFMTGDQLPIFVEGYLPDQNYTTLWSNGTSKYDTFVEFSVPMDKKFTVCFPVEAGAASRGIAETIASRLPLGQTTQAVSADDCGENMSIIPCDDETLPCRVVTMVSVPGENLNNARSMNFGGVYRNGACVPVPDCPGSMVPQIFVSPVSVSGLYEGMNGPSSTSGDVIPLSSFTAYIKEPVDTNVATGPKQCTTDTEDACYADDTKALLPPGKYWRVCLDIVTENGKLSGSKWVKQSGSVAAITRCAPPEEPAGSSFDYFINR